MHNTGLLLANDSGTNRIKALKANLQRLGVTNAIVTNLDGRMLKKHCTMKFDRALVDAPCSGLGTIDKDPSIKLRTLQDLGKLSHIQRELLLTAIDCVSAKLSGIIVYSTCSYSLEENEKVV
mmetsp:Transcript_10394/g.5334  ORF Transcript_10394/g.5334 Transcript_10394/m.5334 type:complete len:122 (+) Transcript_10394:302-667(+)